MGLFSSGVAKLFGTFTAQKFHRCAAVRHMARKVPFRAKPLEEIFDDFSVSRDPGRIRPERPKTKAAKLQKQKGNLHVELTTTHLILFDRYNQDNEYAKEGSH
jgi:hypothetical protein